MEKILLSELHDYIGGKATNSNDFLICNDYIWPKEVIGFPYRAEGTAMMLCTHGTAKILINMRELKVSRGSVLMYGRESLVEFLEISDDCRVNFVFLAQSFLQDTMPDLKSIIPIFKYIAENLLELISLTEYEIAVLSKYYELMYAVIDFEKIAITRDLLTAFMRTLGELYSRRIVDTSISRTRHEEYLENFLDQIGVHYKKERSVKFYADALHITPKYLSTVIKEISGKSAASLINEFVIQEAKILLKFSGKSVQEITYQLNFSTQSFFGKYFKRHTGMSPSEYRLAE